MSGKGKGKPKKLRQYQIERQGVSDFLVNAVGFNRGDGTRTPPMPPLGEETVAVGNNLEVALSGSGSVVDVSSISSEHNDVAAASSPHDMGRPCPKLSDAQYRDLLYQVQKAVEQHGGHLEYDPSSGSSLDEVWRDLIFPALFDDKTGILGQLGVRQPKGKTAPKNWRKKFLDWQTEVIAKHNADAKTNPNLRKHPCVDKAEQLLMERDAGSKSSRAGGTKKRQKEADNANLENHSRRMGLENDLVPKRLKAAGLCYGGRADGSTIDPRKKVPRHEDHVKGLTEQIEKGKKIEDELSAILKKSVGNIDGDLQRINLIGATIKSLNEQAKGYKDFGLEVPAWIRNQIKDLEKEQQDVFKARKNQQHH